VRGGPAQPAQPAQPGSLYINWLYINWEAKREIALM
jgi:hypothetical protein